MPLSDIDPCLLWILRRAGDEWGPLGVAVAAARLSDPEAVIATLTENPRRRKDDPDLPHGGWDGKVPQKTEECHT